MTAVQHWTLANRTCFENREKIPISPNLRFLSFSIFDLISNRRDVDIEIFIWTLDDRFYFMLFL